MLKCVTPASASFIGCVTAVQGRQGHGLHAVLLAEALWWAFGSVGTVASTGRCPRRGDRRPLRRAWLRAAARIATICVADGGGLPMVVVVGERSGR